MAMKYRCRAGHEALHDDGRCHAAVFGKECGLELLPVANVIRDPACVERWPECHEGGYDPRCCRFPKSCSCTVNDPQS